MMENAGIFLQKFQPSIKRGRCDFLYEDKREIDTHTVKGTWGRGKTFSLKVPQFFPKN